MSNKPLPLMPSEILAIARAWKLPAEKVAEIEAEWPNGQLLSLEEHRQGRKVLRPGSFSGLMLDEAAWFLIDLQASGREILADNDNPPLYTMKHPPDQRTRRKYQKLQKQLREGSPKDIRSWGVEDRSPDLWVSYALEKIEESAARIASLLAVVFDKLPAPRWNHPADLAAVRRSIPRLCVIYRDMLQKNPGKGITPFAQGVHIFLRATYPPFAHSLAALGKLIERTLQ